MKHVLILIIVAAMTMPAAAELVRQNIEYSIDGQPYEGYVVFDDAQVEPRPGVLVCHEWWGLNDYAKSRADQLAHLGYIALACDIYGKGQRATTAEDAQKLAGPFYTDRARMRTRVRAGLDELLKHPLTDKQRVAVIGYCFGGMAALELARSGADIKGVVSFHGSLATPNPEDAQNIKAKVLVLHGADDPHVNAEQVAAFEEEMRKAGVDWQLVAYGGAVHAFTNPAAGNDPATGAAYNEQADRRSWQAMKDFFNEIC